MHRQTLARAWRAAGLAALSSAAFAPMAMASPVVQPFQTIPHGNGDSNPGNVVSNGASTFFTANDGTHGSEPYVSSAAGSATLLADIAPGSASSYASSFTAVGDLTYFLTSNQLWVSDGTPGGTHAVPFADAGTTNLTSLTASGGTLYLRGSIEDGPNSVLFRVSTTTGELEDVAEFSDYLDRILPGPDGGVYVFSWTIGGNGYPIFHPNYVSAGGDVHRFTYVDGDDQTQAYTAKDSDSAASAGGLLYWSGVDGKIFASSPTDDSTTEVTDGADSLPTNTSATILDAGDGSALIQGTDHLYRATATTASAVADESDAALSDGQAVLAGGKLYYQQDSVIRENDLSGPTSESTTVSPAGYAHGLAVSGGAAYFIETPASGTENVYRTTGGAAVPQLAADQFIDGNSGGFGGLGLGSRFVGLSFNSDFGQLIPQAGGGVSFGATTRAQGDELFVTPATPGDQAPILADVNTTPRSVYLGGDTGSTVSFGAGKALFSVNDGFTDQPWVSDGTPAGTHPLLPASTDSREISAAKAFGDKAVFVMQDRAADDTGVWITDGTAGGTTELFGSTQSYAIAGSSIYSLVDGNDEDRTDIAVSDGTTAGTTTLAPPSGAPSDWNPTDVVAAGTHVYFSVQSEEDGGTWAYDTVAHTWEQVLTDDDGYFPFRYAVAGGDKLYLAEAQSHGPKTVWSSDGTRDGTHLVNLESSPTSNRNYQASLFVSGSTVFALTEADGSGTYPTGHLWKIDDSAHTDDPDHKDGTQIDGNDGVDLSSVPQYTQFTSGPGGIYGVSGNSLYRVGDDGAVSTLHTFDDRGESNSVDLYNSLVVGGTLYFSGYDTAHGTEPWTTDGTAAGTSLLADTIPGPTSGYPGAYAYAGGQLLFSIDTGDGGAIYSYGEQLATAPTPTPTATPVPTPTPTPTPTTAAPTDTPAPAAAPTPTATPKPIATPTPTPVDSRPVPRKVSTSADPLAETKSAFRFDLSGSVLGAAGLSSKAQCRGQVEVVVTATTTKGKGKKAKKVVKTIGTYKLKLAWTDGKCTYDKVITIAKKSVPEGAKLQATTTFRGSQSQAPRTGTPITLDIS